MKREPFATTSDGQTVERITLTNRNGMHVRIITWGANLTEIHVPDRDGSIADVTLGGRAQGSMNRDSPGDRDQGEATGSSR